MNYEINDELWCAPFDKKINLLFFNDKKLELFCIKDDHWMILKNEIFDYNVFRWDYINATDLKYIINTKDYTNLLYDITYNPEKKLFLAIIEYMIDNKVLVKTAKIEDLCF